MSTIKTFDDLFMLLRQGLKIKNENWHESEFIYYNPEIGVLDENDDEVNLSVLMNNWYDGNFYY